MPPSRHSRLTEQEDAQLREIEQDPYLKPKVCLRALVVRLSNRGSNMEKIASYTDRSPASVARDLDHWTENIANSRRRASSRSTATSAKRS